jgi:hypothetical protein
MSQAAKKTDSPVGFFGREFLERIFETESF